MGEVRVPADALWRAQTQRAVENFPISGRPIESAQIRALALIKGACAQANAELGILPASIVRDVGLQAADAPAIVRGTVDLAAAAAAGRALVATQARLTGHAPPSPVLPLRI